MCEDNIWYNIDDHINANDEKCLSSCTPCLLGRYSLRVRQNAEVVDGQAVAEGGEVCIQYFSNVFIFICFLYLYSMMHLTLEVPNAEKAFSQAFAGENQSP